MFNIRLIQNVISSYTNEKGGLSFPIPRPSGNTKTQKKKLPKHNIKDGHQTTREQKRRGERKRCIKQLTKWQKEHMHACLLSRV